MPKSSSKMTKLRSQNVFHSENAWEENRDRGADIAITVNKLGT